MATTPEGKIKDKIKKLLKEHHVYWFCPVQNGMGAPSLDFLCCFSGQFIGIEAKAPGKKPTPRQLNTMDQMFSCGGDVFVIYDDRTLDLLDQYLKGKKEGAINEYLINWMVNG